MMRHTGRRFAWTSASALAGAALVVLAASTASLAARDRRPTADNPQTSGRQPPPDDDLYRRRGYGTGGLTFGLGRQGGTAQAGACADLAFARPRNCGPQGGYGVYGNGLGYGFGF